MPLIFINHIFINNDATVDSEVDFRCEDDFRFPWSAFVKLLIS